MIGRRAGWPAAVAVLLVLTGLPATAGPAVGAGSQASPETTRVDVGVADADGRPLADVSVTLEVHDGRQTLATLEGRTDESGTVGWDEVPAAPGYHARATAVWSEARYPSATVTLAAGEPTRLDIQVFETSGEGRPLHLDTLHLIVQMDEPGVARVLQFMTVSNAGDAAWAGGPALEDGRRAGVVIPLPDSAENLAAAPFPTAEEALVLSRAEVRTDAVLDPRPVPPEGRQVAVTYDVIVDDDGADLRFELPYPTASVSVLLGGPAAGGVELETDDLQSRPPEQIGDQQFDLWTANALQPGSEIAFSVGRAGLRIATEYWALLALGAGLFLAVGATWLSAVGGTRSPADREEILRRIAALDLQHDAGEIEAAEYFQRRGRELERLAVLERLVGRRAADGRPDDSKAG